MTLIAIGVDQSTTKTGLCMRRFIANGNSKVIRAATIDTPGYNDMRRSLLTFIGLLTPTVIMCEDGFPRCNVMTTVTAAWVEAVVCQYNLGEMFDKVSASEWRKAVWPDANQVKCGDCDGTGSDYTMMDETDIGQPPGSSRIDCRKCNGTGIVTKRMKSADWKAYSIVKAKAAGIVDPDDHQGDADGICQYAIKMYTEGSR